MGRLADLEVATHQIELQVDTAKFEVPSCADHAEMVRLGWRGER